MDSRPGGKAERMSDLPSPQENAHARTKVLRLEAENTRLKTEVEHLMIFCNCTLIPNKELQDENARLKTEVERLRKAGDLLCFHYISLARKRWPDDPLPSSVTAWNAAKEGKPTSNE